MENQDDDIPQLSAETFSALQEFYKEQEQKEQIVNELNSSMNSGNDNPNISEDWQLSQFWYDDETALTLAKEIVRLANISGKHVSVACVSCPTLYSAIKKHFPQVTFKGILFVIIYSILIQFFLGCSVIVCLIGFIFSSCIQ